MNGDDRKLARQRMLWKSTTAALLKAKQINKGHVEHAWVYRPEEPRIMDAATLQKKWFCRSCGNHKRQCTNCYAWACACGRNRSRPRHLLVRTEDLMTSPGLFQSTVMEFELAGGKDMNIEAKLVSGSFGNDELLFCFRD